MVSESISTSSTVGLTGGGLRIATLGVAEGEPDGVRPRDREQYTQRRRRYTLRRLRVGRQSIRERSVVPECECFDTGIVRSIRMYEDVGILRAPYNVSLVMGVASGMPCDPRWVPLLADEISPAAQWQVIAIGRREVWDVLRAGCELGGNVRTGRGRACSLRPSHCALSTQPPPRVSAGWLPV